MSFDCSRFSFQPWKDFLGVVMQQGRVQLDSDWNEWLAELGRRFQAGTLDAVGRAGVPSVTPDAFRILAAGADLAIGRGRIYVDGLLAENHGAPPLLWDAALAELRGSVEPSFFEQPYLPFHPAEQQANAGDPAAVFNRPAFVPGRHLVYVDVWQREVTHLQEPELVEKAVGVDTTARLQTVWQVKTLGNMGGAGCATPDGELPGWAALIRPSGARLSTSTGDVPAEENPCLVPPAAGYKGLENQLYRVEVHRGGPLAQATFKWSRDNATVASRVLEIQGNDRLVVESLGRDQVLSFHAGDWIEVLDDWHEFHGLPGVLRRVQEEPDATTRTILLEDPVPPGLFPVDGQGRTDASRHTRVRRWDQAAAAGPDGVPVSAASGAPFALEHGVQVEFSLEAGGELKTGDSWVFAARTADGSLEILEQAPPRSVHHHYARLAMVQRAGESWSLLEDCRQLFPPAVEWGREVAEGCCEVTVGPGGQFQRLEEAIAALLQGGRRNADLCLCLLPGEHLLPGGLTIAAGATVSVQIRGCAGARLRLEQRGFSASGLRAFTLRELALAGGEIDGALQIQGCAEVALDGCTIHGRGDKLPLVDVGGSRRVRIEGCTLEARRAGALDVASRIYSSLGIEPNPLADLDREQFATTAREAVERLAVLAGTRRAELARLLSERLHSFTSQLGLAEFYAWSHFKLLLLEESPAAAEFLAALEEARASALLTRPGEALVLRDDAAEMSLAGNLVLGVVSLYDRPAGRPLANRELQNFAALLRRGAASVFGSPGALQMHGNRLARLETGGRVVEAVRAATESGGAVTQVLRRAILGDNVLEAELHHLVAEQVGFHDNHLGIAAFYREPQRTLEFTPGLATLAGAALLAEGATPTTTTLTATTPAATTTQPGVRPATTTPAATLTSTPASPLGLRQPATGLTATAAAAAGRSAALPSSAVVFEPPSVLAARTSNLGAGLPALRSELAFSATRQPGLVRDPLGELVLNPEVDSPESWVVAQRATYLGNHPGSPAFAVNTHLLNLSATSQKAANLLEIQDL